MEDPIEFMHRHQSCIVNQREIGTDTKSFSTALKYALREDPDVILVGEMRDLETIAAALTIAETGHLALATLHTNSAAESINRIIDVFPSNQQSQVRAQLAFVLEGVRDPDAAPQGSRGRGRVMACEIMVVTPAIRALIRDDKIHQIHSAMQAGKKHGMQTMNDALFQLYTNREVAPGGVRAGSSEPKEFLRMIGVTPMEDQDIAPHRWPRANSGPPLTGEPHDADVRVHRPHADGSDPEGPDGRRQQGRRHGLPAQEPADHGERAGAAQADQAQLGSPRIKTRDIVIFTRQFATMINAGLPLVQSLNILAAQTENKALADVTRAVVYDVESGNTLADAFSKHPKAFSAALRQHGGRRRGRRYPRHHPAPPGHVPGEERRPGPQGEGRDGVSGRHHSVAMIAIAILLIFVIPTFQSMFASANLELPLPTRIVIGMSDFLIHFWWAILLAIGGIVVRHQELLRHAGRPAPDRRRAAQGAGAGRRDPEVGRVPLHPDARHAGELGREILEGLEITAKTAGNQVVHDAVMESRQCIAGGETIAAPLEKSKVFPPMVIRMIAVGEQTGGLDEMLSKIADFYDEEVDVAVSALLSLMEPAMIVILGVIVGGMVIAMYLPIFDMMNAVQ